MDLTNDLALLENHLDAAMDRQRRTTNCSEFWRRRGGRRTSAAAHIGGQCASCDGSGTRL